MRWSLLTGWTTILLLTWMSWHVPNHRSHIIRSWPYVSYPSFCVPYETVMTQQNLLNLCG